MSFGCVLFVSRHPVSPARTDGCDTQDVGIIRGHFSTFTSSHSIPQISWQSESVYYKFIKVLVPSDASLIAILFGGLISHGVLFRKEKLGVLARFV